MSSNNNDDEMIFLVMLLCYRSGCLQNFSLRFVKSMIVSKRMASIEFNVRLLLMLTCPECLLVHLAVFLF